MKPGAGYWVKADSTVKLVLTPSFGQVPKKEDEPISDVSSLVFRDARGGQQILYFGSSLKGNLPLTRYELPPSPPSGIFDARFASGRMLETLDGKDAKEVPITIAAASNPVVMSWMVHAGISAIFKIGKQEFNLVNTGSISIGNMGMSASLKFSAGQPGEMPVQFALDQNYPNPFNPSTVIRYALPMASKVRITVFNLLGQEVRTLVDEVQETGNRFAEWNTSNIANGVYFYRLDATSVSDPSKHFSQTRKMVLIK
jgi:hypothetical protein